MKIKQSTSVKLNETEIELILSIFTSISEQSIGFNKLKLDKEESTFINQFLKIFKPDEQPPSIPQADCIAIQTISDIGFNPLGNLTDIEQ